VVVCLEKAVVMKLVRRSVALRELSLLMLDLQVWLVIRLMKTPKRQQNVVVVQRSWQKQPLSSDSKPNW
jgi:hypothetical protein